MDVFHQVVVDQLAEISGKSPETIAPLIEIPPQANKGDRAVPCFQWAKEEKASPKVLASRWHKMLQSQGLPPEIEKVEAVGGYLNFFLNHHFVASHVLGEIRSHPGSYGYIQLENPTNTVLEFSSPNIAKPFSIGHLRTTNIGAALGRIFEARGHRVTRINHLGDWGTQFGKLISAYRRWGNAELLKDHPIHQLYKLYVRWHEEEISDPTLIEDAREWFSRLEDGDEEAKELWEWFREVTIRELKTLYTTLDVDFDHYWGESFYTGQLLSVLQELEEKKISKKSDDATIVDLEEEGLAKCVVRKSDESSLYMTRDLAAAIYRQDQFNFDEMIYVVGAPQRLHFQQLFKILEKMGHAWAKKCEHVAFGHMSFGDEAMSTRKGNIVFLSDVLDEAVALAQKIVEEKNPTLEDKETVAKKVGLGAILFADLSSKRIKDVRFSWDEILTFDGETGPYLQYSLVRAKSILRRYDKPIEPEVPEGTLQKKEEAALVRFLSRFPSVLAKAEEAREPFLVAQYLVGLAKTFNKFYTVHRILDAPTEEDTRARVLLVFAYADVLDTGLRLLGIPRPEQM